MVNMFSCIPPDTKNELRDVVSRHIKFTENDIYDLEISVEEYRNKVYNIPEYTPSEYLEEKLQNLENSLSKQNENLDNLRALIDTIDITPNC